MEFLAWLTPQQADFLGIESSLLISLNFGTYYPLMVSLVQLHILPPSEASRDGDPAIHIPWYHRSSIEITVHVSMIPSV